MQIPPAATFMSDIEPVASLSEIARKCNRLLSAWAETGQSPFTRDEMVYLKASHPEGFQLLSELVDEWDLYSEFDKKHFSRGYWFGFFAATLPLVMLAEKGHPIRLKS